MEILLDGFWSQNHLIIFVVDALGHLRISIEMLLWHMTKVDAVDYLVLTESERPHKAFEIISGGILQKINSASIFMKIMPRSEVSSGDVLMNWCTLSDPIVKGNLAVVQTPRFSSMVANL